MKGINEILRFILLGAAMCVVALSCIDERQLSPCGDGDSSQGVDLFVKLSMQPDGNLSISTKAGAATKDGNSSNVNEYSETRDGNVACEKIHRLALFVVNKDMDKLVAYRVIDKHEVESEVDENYFIGNDATDIQAKYYEPGTEVTYINALGEEVTEEAKGNGYVDPDTMSDIRLTFLYNDPLHGNTERLLPGDYVFFAVANWGRSSILASGKGRPFDPEQGNALTPEEIDFGHQNMVMGDYLEAVIECFNDNGGIENFSKKETMIPANDKDGNEIPGGVSIQGFYNFAFRLTDYNSTPSYEGQSYERLADNVIPASHVVEEFLSPGLNEFTIPLKRVTSRVRLSVRNNSTSDLTISNLSFSNNWGQGNLFLFPHSANAYLGWSGTERRYFMTATWDRFGNNTAPDLDIYGRGAFDVSNAVRPVYRFVKTKIVGRNSTETIPEDTYDATQRVLPNNNKYIRIFETLFYGTRDLVNDYTYTVTLSYDDLTRTVTIPVKVFRTDEGGNPTTEPEFLHGVNRNEFIDLRLGVSYNTNTGVLEFAVDQWEEVTSDIEFN